MIVLSDVQGQEEGTRFLRRVVEGSFTSPLLLVGDAGVGRRFSALQAVKETFCVGMRESGCKCADCTQIDHGVHPDLTVILATEEKQIDVDTIREIIQSSMNNPSSAGCQYIILDGVDRMTTAAANAFLKTLEEPPPKVRFLLISESYERVIPTIRSRCGKISYRPLPESFVVSVVQRYEPDSGKAFVYARMGEGSVGRSLLFWGSGRLGLRDKVFGLIQLALDKDIPSLFSATDQIAQDLQLALRFVDHLLHDVLMVQQHPDRLINTDLRENIVRLRARAPLSTWMALGEKVQRTREQSRRTRINLAFHVKTLLLQTLVASAAG